MLGLSQEDLAAAAGVTPKTLAGIEAEAGRPFASTRLKIVQALEKAGIEFVSTPHGVGLILRSN